VPAIEHGSQRFPLGPFDDGAAVPGDRLDLAEDGALDKLAKIVRIERVQFPTAVPVVADEPRVARVFPLVGCRERGQAVEMLPQELSD